MFVCLIVGPVVCLFDRFDVTDNTLIELIIIHKILLKQILLINNNNKNSNNNNNNFAFKEKQQILIYIQLLQTLPLTDIFDSTVHTSNTHDSSREQVEHTHTKQELLEIQNLLIEIIELFHTSTSTSTSVTSTANPESNEVNSSKMQLSIISALSNELIRRESEHGQTHTPEVSTIVNEYSSFDYNLFPIDGTVFYNNQLVAFIEVDGPHHFVQTHTQPHTNEQTYEQTYEQTEEIVKNSEIKTHKQTQSNQNQKKQYNNNKQKQREKYSYKQTNTNTNSHSHSQSHRQTHPKLELRRKDKMKETLYRLKHPKVCFTRINFDQINRLGNEYISDIMADFITIIKNHQKCCQDDLLSVDSTQQSQTQSQTQTTMNSDMSRSIHPNSAHSATNSIDNYIDNFIQTSNTIHIDSEYTLAHSAIHNTHHNNHVNEIDRTECDLNGFILRSAERELKEALDGKYYDDPDYYLTHGKLFDSVYADVEEDNS